MLAGLLYLIGFQLLGHLLGALLGLPIPAAVLGLVLLLIYLLVRGQVPPVLADTGAVLLPLLPLFLIPPSVGIIEYGELLRRDGVAIALALLVSLLLTFLLVPYLFQFFIRLFRR